MSKETRPSHRNAGRSKVFLNGKQVHDAVEDPKKFARRIVQRRRQRDKRAELAEIGLAIKAKLK